MTERLNIISNQNTTNGEEFPFQNSIEWDAPLCTYKGNTFLPKVFWGEGNADEFNSELITLDGAAKSDLNWTDAYSKARAAIEAGRKVLWHLDMGLFNSLPFSVYHNTQFLTLSLAVDHFCNDTWPTFGSESLGVVIYVGDIAFSDVLDGSEASSENLRSWLKETFSSIENCIEVFGDEVSSFEEVQPSHLETSPAGKKLLQRYTCEVGVDYLDILTQSVSDQIECFAFVDASSVDDPAHLASLLTAGSCHRIRFCIKNSSLPYQDLGWDTPSPFGYIGAGTFSIDPKEEKYPLGLCVPESNGEDDPSFHMALEKLLEKQVPFRLIPEELLTTAWDGLDYLIVSSASLSPQGLRKLQGFCAAGGTVVTSGEMLNLPYEESFASWIANSVL